MGLNVVLSLLLIRLFTTLGWAPHGGLALANSIAVTVEMVILLIFLGGLIGGLSEPGFGQSLLRMSLATAGMAAALLLFLPFLSDNVWLAGIGGITIGGLVYLGLAYLLDIKEWKVIHQQLRRRRPLSG